MFFLAVFDSGENVWASIGKYFLSVVVGVVVGVVGAVVVGVAMAATVAVACAGIWVGNVV